MKIKSPHEYEQTPIDEHMHHKGRRHCHHKPINERLHVMTVVYNPYRYRTRYHHYWPFRRMVTESGAVLWTIEIAQRNAEFEVTQAEDPYDLQLRTSQILWHKERAANVLFRYITQYGCPGAQNFALIDADVTFQNPRWVDDTLQWLQHYKVLQMFSHALDLDSNYEPIMSPDGLPKVQTGFIYRYLNAVRQNQPTGASVNTQKIGSETHDYHGGTGREVWHPGYAWAWRRSALNDVGGFGDISILGSGDRLMACALIGELETSIHSDILFRKSHQTFRDYWLHWESRCNRYINRNVGYMPGLITHMFHGSKRRRGYGDRWKILADNDFNYLHDISLDAQGLYQFTGNKPRLEAQIKEYFRSRDEDDKRVD